MAQVKLVNVEKTFNNGLLAVQGLNLEINDGEFMVIVGPSGCAKSTTLRMIAGLEELSSGDILFDGKSVKDVSPKDRGIAMVFQNYALYPHMNVEDNMSFGLKLSNVPKKNIEMKIDEVSKILEMEEYLSKKPSQLSGGQRQRVAVGRAMVRDPEIFLFDEPLSNLDAKLRVHMRVQIIKLHKELKKSNKKSTMVYVTHDQVEAMTMGDRICVMSYGKIMQIDTPINLYEKPANKFVGSFIGTPAMNIQKAEIIVKGSEVYVKLGNNMLLLPPEKAKRFYARDEQKIWFGIRPEDISVSFSEKNNEPLTGKVSIVEQLGSEAYAYIKINTEKNIIMRTEAINGLAYDEDCIIYLDMTKCHIFDFFTEKNLCL